MKLMECYIENFGVLHQFTYQPKNGLNCECLSNGSGKTTFAAFLRAMFYGMPATRTKKLLDDAERKKYRPWQGGTWGGYLIFECRGKVYQLERTFGDRDKEDTFRLIDRNTGLTCDDYTTEIGYELFGVDRMTFSSTVFVTSPGMRVSMNDSIGSSLGAGQEITEDNLSFDRAIEAIEREYKLYVKTGNRGLIAEQEQKLTRLQQEIWDKTREYENLQQSMKQENQNITQDHDQNQLLGLSAAEQSRLEQLDDYFFNGVPEQEELNQKRQLLEKKKRRLSEQAEQLERAGQLGRNGNRTEDSEQDQSNNQKITFIKGILLLGILIGVVGVVAAVMNQQMLTAVGEFAIIAVLTAVYVFTSKNESKRKNRINHDPVVDLPHTDQSSATEIRNRINSLQQQERKLAELEKYRLEYLYLSDKEENAKKAIRIVENEKQSLRLENLKNRERELSDGVVALRKQLEECQDELAEYQKKADLLFKSMNFMRKAKEQYSASYLDYITRYFSEYLELFDSEIARHATLDVELNVNVMDRGMERQIEYYSSGYRDIMWFCERMSLIQSIYAKECPFIIMDDPFINFDDKMLQKVSTMLNEIGKNYQIIYLTCQSARILS